MSSRHEVDLQKAFYAVGSRAANPYEFLSFVRRHVRRRPGSSDLGELLQHVAASLRARARSVELLGSREALLLCFAEDVEGLIEGLPAGDAQLESLEESLRADFVRYQALLHGLGAKFDSEPQLHIVDVFPPPYAGLAGHAIAPDESDHSRYGIAPGVYCRRNRLAPVYSSTVLAHELVHVVVGQRDDGLLARGLEEGICELVGVLHLSGKVLGQDAAESVFRINRLSVPQQRAWELYLDYSRLASSLLLNLGLEGIVRLLNKGRRAIKEAEAGLLSGSGRPGVELTDEDQLLWRSAQRLLMEYPRNLIVSPLALHVSRFVEVGASLEDVANRASVSVADARRGCEELQDGVFLLVLDGDAIAYSDVENVGREWLKYEIPPDNG